MEKIKKTVTFAEVAEPRQYVSKHELSVIAKEVAEPRQYRFKRAAFTLAEVLITLGIIGIVAAMTIPTLMQKYQHKALEVAFKKVHSNLANAIKLTINDDLYPIQRDIPTIDNPFFQQMLTHYRTTKEITGPAKNKYSTLIMDYTRKKNFKFPECSQYPRIPVYELSDGSFFSQFYNCGALNITVDTNGYKGPNAYGHDIFLFRLTDSGMLIPATYDVEVYYDENGVNAGIGYNNSEEIRNKCSINSKSVINGVTCGVQAVKNECPDDSSKTYWECLP